MKRIISTVLALSLVLAMSVPVAAVEELGEEQIKDIDTSEVYVSEEVMEENLQPEDDVEGDLTDARQTDYKDASITLVDTVVKMGDTIDFGGSYVLINDLENQINTITTYLLTRVTDNVIFEKGQWEFRDDSRNYIYISGNSQQIPIGFKVSGGTGTQEDPYTLALVFDDDTTTSLVGSIAKLNDTINFGEAIVSTNDDDKYSSYQAISIKISSIEWNDHDEQWLFKDDDYDQIFYFSGTASLIPVGFYVSGGDGSEDNPYTLAILYEGDTVIVFDFLPEGGTGTMAKAACVAGKNFTLPECTFIEPPYQTFAGWKLENEEVMQAGEEISLSVNYSFTATWKMATFYDVAFFGNGGKWSDGETQKKVTVNPGSDVTAPGEPEYEGYIFVEWNTKDDGTGETAVFTNITTSKKYYAIWRNYTVTFIGNGGKWSDDTTTKEVAVNRQGKIRLPSEPEYDGHSFKEWNTKEDGTGETAEFIRFTSDKTFYAIWIDNGSTTSCIVTFIGNGGKWPDNEAQNEVTVNSGSDVNAPDGLEYEGYTFVEWNTKQDGTGETADLTNITSNKTFYAKWKKAIEKEKKDEPEKTEDLTGEETTCLIKRLEGNVLIVGDKGLLSISGVDNANVILKGKAGLYDSTTGMVTAIKKGSIKLYESYKNDKGKTMKRVVCKIKVEQPKLKNSLKLKEGKLKKLKLSGTKTTPDTWTSSDAEVVAVTGDGTLTARKPGTATVTAKLGTHTYDCIVIVK